MRSFHEDLEQAVAYHGHLCSGQIIGVRMARFGLKLLGITQPEHNRDLIVYLESDRCLADAVGTVTGCKLGRRRLKWLDYGKSAATFLDLQTGRAVRIYRKYRVFPPEGADMTAFYEAISDEDLFYCQEVTVPIVPTDLPGKPLEVQRCSSCGEEVLDGRHVEKDGHIFCKACYYGAYYQEKQSHGEKQ